jgi:hypothetical protein
MNPQYSPINLTDLYSDKVTQSFSDDNTFTFFSESADFDLIAGNFVNTHATQEVSVSKPPPKTPNRMIPQAFTFPTNIPSGNLVKLSEEESKASQRGSWRIVSANKQVLGSDGDVFVYLETRSSKGSEVIDTDLFSSIQYELRQKVEGAFTKNTPFLLSRLQVVDPATGEEIRKNNKTILAGMCESTLSPNNRENNVFETTMKFKFTDVSYHHDKRPFALRVSLFLNSNTDEPIIIKQSEPIMVFARKKPGAPVKKSKTSQKRKAGERDELEDSQDVVEPNPKVAKTIGTQEVKRPHPNSSEEFNDFMLKLEALFAQVAQMNPQDKVNAVHRILQKMYEIDPQYNLFFQPPQIGFIPSFAVFDL